MDGNSWSFFMRYKVNVVIEKDRHGYYAHVPALPGCQTQGDTFEEVLKNAREATRLYLRTLSRRERTSLLSKEILTTALEVSVA
jgi:predicted RNase H-like HicB family nuclease